ncbi:MAG TPA: LPS export ABC transporter periplasmic protein LptC [Gemmatimonadales bacterium]|nr:LPS export ABC transporter periplasmic protein LptC [Gemmatimonadales bacterium]
MRRLLAWLAALALVAGCKEDGTKVTTIVSVADSADQVLEGFRHFVTANGVRKSEIEADTAFFYDATQITLLRRMRVVFFDSAGATRATLTAQRGTYLWQTGNLDAEGRVEMKSADGRVLRSEKLKIDQEKQQLSSDTAFTFLERGSYVEGKSFTSDMNFSNIRASQPTGRSSGQGLLLPGQ